MDYTVTWNNQSGIEENGITKWILILKDSAGNTIKTHGDTTASKLKNFSLVSTTMGLTQDEALKQTRFNTMNIYYNTVDEDRKLGEISVIFDRNNLALDVRNVETLPPPATKPGDVITCKRNDVLVKSDNNFKYILNDRDEIKWLAGDIYTPISGRGVDCSPYLYTGIEGIKTSTNDRCGPWHGSRKCPGNQCCSSSGWCGGTVGRNSSWCANYYSDSSKHSTGIIWNLAERWKYTNRSYLTWQYAGAWDRKYDGTDVENQVFNFWKPGGILGITESSQTFKVGNVVKCKTNDPLNDDTLNTVYKYTGNNTIKNYENLNVMRRDTGNYIINESNSGELVYNCAGLKYGGVIKEYP